MILIDAVLIFQAVFGAFDNLWHHEWQARLPQQRGARRELRLHAARDALYGALFLGIAWWAWHGAWALLVGALLLAEIGITLADFLEEDRSRQLPPLERLLHTVLTLSYGFFIALMGALLLDWASRPTGLAPAGRGALSWLYTVMAIGVWAWGVRDLLAARRLDREASADEGAIPRPVPVGASAVLVTGGTGFVGRALIAKLRAEGRRVIVLTRDVRQARLQFDRTVAVVGDLDEIASETRIAAIVHLAGARVLGRPWTPARRRQLVESRTRVAEALQRLVRRLEQRPAVLVAASAVGFYGTPAADTVCDEDSLPMKGVFQSELCAAVEHEASRFEAQGLRVVRLRLGLVLGREDGAWPMQAIAARLGLAARLGDGRQPLPWIHRDDAVGLIAWSLGDLRVRGAVNAVAPGRCDQAAFSHELAASFGRPAWLRLPAWPLRRLAGEMSTLLLDGQAVVPRRALDGGYRFVHPTLQGALQDLAAEPRAQVASPAANVPAR